MFTKTSAAALCLAALSSTVSAYGSATIKNQCSQSIYLWPVINTQGEMQTIAPGGSYSHEYEINPDGGGASDKISLTPDNSGAITQLEYTVTNMLWYDVSNINGYPFMATGLTLTTSDNNCRSVVCEAGVELCSAAYNVPDDNQATAACGSDADITLVLCSGQKGSAPVAAASSVAAATSKIPTQDLQAATPATPATTAASSSSESAAAPPTTSAATLAQVSTAANGGVATTFVTHMVTVVAAAGSSSTPAADSSSSSDDDWSFFHHPADLGMDWGFVEKRDSMHKRAAHRHHHHRRAAVAGAN